MWPIYLDSSKKSSALYKELKRERTNSDTIQPVKTDIKTPNGLGVITAT